MSKKPKPTRSKITDEPTVLTAPLRIPMSLRNKLNTHLAETENMYSSTSEMLKAEGFRDKNSMWIQAMREFLDRHSK